MAVGVAAEVKSKLSVVEVVGETVTLKKAGTTYKGLCPFHGEKTPSFVVTPARENWHCFGCGLHGDIFSFVMQRDGATFAEALRTLAERAGVEIDERTKREDARKARLRQVLDHAIAFYHAVLTSSKTGAAALEYVHGRGITDASIETLPARLGARRLGPDDAHAPGQARRPSRGARGGRPGRAAVQRPAGRLRQVPLAGHLPDPRRVRPRRRPRRPPPRGRGAEVPQLRGDAALRQEPHALPHRQGEGADPAHRRPGRHRRGLHGRADGPPGRLRQRRRQPRHGAHARAGRAAHPLRGPHRAGVRRRRGRREGGHARGPGAGRARGPAPARLVGGQARGRPRRPAARRQGSRRGRPRVARGVDRGHRRRQAARRVPHRPPRGALRPEARLRADRLRRGGHARRSATSPTRSAATRRSRRSGASRASRTARFGPSSIGGSPRPRGPAWPATRVAASPRTRCSRRRTRCRSTTSSGR